MEDGEAFIYVADEDAPHESDHGGWIPVPALPPCLCGGPAPAPLP